MKNKKIYLAIPYTWDAEKSFHIANKVAAELMAAGGIVYSPISHSHSIADHLPGELRFDQPFWMAQDLPLIAWADAVVVLVIGENGDALIANSKGVQTEIAEAKKQGKEIIKYQYNE